ncbi:MAG: hypothetical protein MRJ68_04425 [Nitrospira sp.]|nr:hypothetical protein [Nitrospira sp.]
MIERLIDDNGAGMMEPVNPARAVARYSRTEWADRIKTAYAKTVEAAFRDVVMKLNPLLLDMNILCYPCRMTDRLRSFLRGIGSTMDISPSDAPKIKDNTEERLHQTWERTGNAIKVSIEQFEREQAS